ncbi:MAG: pseudouridine-5'-phosphate glycosidase [Armatimonadetes bacterium]|nr:pseudouridine-5'-phosphate glycosidase [Armatimonadota bacterium]
MPAPDLLRFSDDVRAALNAGRPVVALETSVWCQGLPFPANVEGARRVNQAVLAQGAVPAVLAVDGGHIRVGVPQAELESWCESRDAIKVGMRELAWAAASGRRGATTVSACLAICEAAGLPLLVTGGIGGVHREARDTWDVSTDLDALARCGVSVVASGTKSILDVPATLETLETLGVPVLGYRTDAFPVFYCASSGHQVPRVDDPAQAAAVVRNQRALGFSQGVLIANPVSAEEGLDPAVVERWVAEALGAASREGVSGKRVTPFLLEYLHGASQGATLRVNLALLEENARVGARIAAEIA